MSRSRSRGDGDFRNEPKTYALDDFGRSTVSVCWVSIRILLVVFLWFGPIQSTQELFQVEYSQVMSCSPVFSFYGVSIPIPSRDDEFGLRKLIDRSMQGGQPKGVFINDQDVYSSAIRQVNFE